MDRRRFVKVTAAGAAVGGVAAAGTGGKLLLERSEAADALAERNGRRPEAPDRWFTPEELAAVAALAAVIVPGGDSGPGAVEAGVPEALDRRIAATPGRQGVYARGLLSFDEAALDAEGVPVAELAPQRRAALVERIHRLRREKVRLLGGGSTLQVVESKLQSLRNALAGHKAAVDFVDTLILDVQREFYSSQVAWEWLGYEGPPFPGGYAAATRKLGPVPPGVPIERAPHGPIRAPCGACHTSA